MSFLNPWLLAGLGLVAIPIVLHFLLRQKPKKLLFPALRLLEQRRRESMRKLRLRHLWLLLLRILALACLVLAVARPSLPPANYGLTAWELGGLLALAAAGIGVHSWNSRRLAATHKHAEYREEQRASSLRWTTAGVLLAMLLFIGWPYQRRIAAEIRDPNPVAVNLPVAAAFVFDNSLSMSFQQEGKTSLDRAQELARAHWETFPAGSRLAITDSGVDHPVTFQSTTLSAQTRLESLAVTPASLPIEDRLRAALQAQLDDRERISGEQESVAEANRKDRYIRRIYLFTDLAKSAWRTNANQFLARELEESKGVNLYIVDLGRDAAPNRAVLNVGLSESRLPEGGELLVSATLLANGESAAEQPVDLLFLPSEGNAVRQGQARPKLDADVPARVDFPLLTGLAGPWIQGEVRIPGSDPLTFDDARQFTVQVAPPPRVLVVAPTEEVAAAWLVASEVKGKFRPEYRPVTALGQLSLADFQAITLINVELLADEVWSQLGKYVEQGGGLIVALGSMEISSPYYNRGPAQAFLPASLDYWQPENDWRFSIDESHRSHPAFALYRALESQQPFALLQNNIYVTRFWKVTPAASTNVLATYTDPERSPAILERPHGKGHTVMITTGVDLGRWDADRWNNFADLVGDVWLYLAFVEQLTSYATQFSSQTTDFLCGEPVTLQLEPAPQNRTFLLQRPNLKQTRHTVPTGVTQLAIPDAVDAGHYSLVNADTREVVRAFSMNPPGKESDLARFTAEELDERLGKDQYRLARDLDQLQEEINTSDLGQEVYPVLLMLLVVVFCGESLVANRFYGKEPAGAAPEARKSA